MPLWRAVRRYSDGATRRAQLRAEVAWARTLYMQGRYEHAYYNVHLMQRDFFENRSVPTELPDGRLFQWVRANGVCYDIIADTKAGLSRAAACVALYEMLRQYKDFDILARRRQVPPPL